MLMYKVAFIDLQKTWRNQNRNGFFSSCLNYRNNPLEILWNRNMNHYDATELSKAVNVQLKYYEKEV